MKKQIALLLALTLAAGGAVFGEQQGGGTVIAVMPGVAVVVPEMPEIKVPKVPKPEETKAPEIEIPEVEAPEIPQVETGLARTDPAPMPTLEPVATVEPLPVESVASKPAPREADAEVEAALDALGEDVYRKTYRALLKGEIIRKGSVGSTARGVQMTLIALGQPISADDVVGPKTMDALNAAQTAFGLEPTRSLDAAGYGELVKVLAKEKAK